MSKNDKKKYFCKLINEGRPDDPLIEEEAMFALHTLSELVWLLYKINEREKIIPLNVLSGERPMPEETEPMEQPSVRRQIRTKKRKQSESSKTGDAPTRLKPIKMS